MISEYLLGKFDIDEFRTKFLNKQYVVVRNASNLASVWGVSALDEYLNVQEGNLHKSVHGRNRGQAVFIPSTSNDGLNRQKKFIERQVLQGTQFKIDELERRVPVLAQLCRTLEIKFGGKAIAMAFVTPPNNKAFNSHFDDESVFAIQLDGKKRWSIYPRIVSDPRPTSGRRLKECESNQSCEFVTLSPGDVLYIPGGVGHCAESLNEHSIHVSIGLSPWTPNHVLQFAINLLSNDEPTLNAPLFLSESNCTALIREAALRCTKALNELNPGKLFLDFQCSVDLTRPDINGHGVQNSLLPIISDETLVRRSSQISVQQVVANVMIQLYVSKLTGKSGKSKKGAQLYIELPKFAQKEVEFLLQIEGAIAVREIPGLLDQKSKITIVRKLANVGILQISR